MWISVFFCLLYWSSKLITMWVAHVCNPIQQQAFSIRSISARLCTWKPDMYSLGAAFGEVRLQCSWRTEAESFRIQPTSNKSSLLSLLLKTQRCSPYTASSRTHWRSSAAAHRRNSQPATRALKQLRSPKISFPPSSKGTQRRHSRFTKDHKHSWGKNTLSLTPTPAHLSSYEKKTKPRSCSTSSAR